jgi:uncharacterized protein involved in type VI secretion and phage assembly
MTDLFTDFEYTERNRVYGLVIGLVKENKPDSLGRIGITLPGLTGQDLVLGARLAVPMAGNGRGTFFLPEKDDEVLVAFECGDVARPYILGALWNGQDKPPYDNADGKNNLRLIKSRSGHIVRFDDTADAEKIEIIDKTGQNSFTIDAKNNVITIKSSQNIQLEAKNGTITLEAKEIKLVSSAATDIQAQGGLSLDGSPGTTTIKGTTVDIN